MQAEKSECSGECVQTVSRMCAECSGQKLMRKKEKKVEGGRGPPYILAGRQRDDEASR